MNHRFVTTALGKLLLVLAAVIVIPGSIALFETAGLPLAERIRDVRLFGFILVAASSLVVGSILVLLPRRPLRGNAVREGFAIVTFGWIVLTLFGCIPLFLYLLQQAPGIGPAIVLRSFSDAYFEIMSGFTTTGATILTDIEVLPKGILFWRSMTHWLGGMGIVTLVLSIFPAYGISAYQMFRGEVPGPMTERLRPSLAQTAKILWGVYALLTLAETALLIFGGMTTFEAFCHAFGTMATGGFSTRNASIAAYNSDYIDWVIVVFMFFAGMNFMLHYRVLFAGDLSCLRADREFRFYVSVLLCAIVVTTIVLQIRGIASPEQAAQSFRHTPLSPSAMAARTAQEGEKVSGLYSTIRYAAFQVVSMTTTTGYTTADFDLWPNAIRFILVLVMFFGGCAGSTGGGIKMIRIMVVLKSAWREVRTMVQPLLIAPVKIAGRALEEKQVANIVAFFVLFLVLFVLFSWLMSFYIADYTTAVSSVISTICNIGPGLSGIGATENYAWIPVPGKWILVACMLLGRLEVYTVLVALSPTSWKK